MLDQLLTATFEPIRIVREPPGVQPRDKMMGAYTARKRDEELSVRIGHDETEISIMTEFGCTLPIPVTPDVEWVDISRRDFSQRPAMRFAQLLLPELRWYLAALFVFGMFWTGPSGPFIGL